MLSNFSFLQVLAGDYKKAIDELAQLTFIAKSQSCCPHLFSSLKLRNNDQKDIAMLTWPQLKNKNKETKFQNCIHSL